MFELIANVKWIAAFLVVVALSVFGSRGLLPSSSYDLNVAMPGADGLYPGSDVLIAGSKAGTVTQISLHGSGVMVGISLDPAHSPVHSSATVTLRPKSLLGEKYLDLNPGSGGDALNAGATIPPHPGSNRFGPSLISVVHARFERTIGGRVRWPTTGWPTVGGGCSWTRRRGSRH